MEYRITWRWHRCIFGFEVYDNETHDLDKLNIEAFEIYILVIIYLFNPKYLLYLYCQTNNAV